MIKLTYKEAKDAAITDAIQNMKSIPIPAKLSWRLMKIHRKLTSEYKQMEEVLRAEWLKHVVKDEKGNPAPVAEEKDGQDVVTKQAQPWQYVEGGKEAHQKAFDELLKTELQIHEDPIDITVLLADDREIPIECLAGVEPLTIDYQNDRAKTSVAS